MVEIKCGDYFIKTLLVLMRKRPGLIPKLMRQLNYLDRYACQADRQGTRCELFQDFEEWSFTFQMYKNNNGTYERWFNGGLIFHDNKEDRRKADWSVHT